MEGGGHLGEIGGRLVVVHVLELHTLGLTEDQGVRYQFVIGPVGLDDFVLPVVCG